MHLRKVAVNCSVIPPADLRLVTEPEKWAWLAASLIIEPYHQGDGPKLVRELFRVAEEHAPSIVFIDEIDAVGTKRYDSNSGGEREIQRTMLELLNQLDGFDSRGDVKVSPL